MSIHAYCSQTRRQYHIETETRDKERARMHVLCILGAFNIEVPKKKTPREKNTHERRVSLQKPRGIVRGRVAAIENISIRILHRI